AAEPHSINLREIVGTLHAMSQNANTASTPAGIRVKSLTISVWTRRRAGFIFVRLVGLLTLERKKSVNPMLSTGTPRPACARTVRLMTVAAPISGDSGIPERIVSGCTLAVSV